MQIPSTLSLPLPMSQFHDVDGFTLTNCFVFHRKEFFKSCLDVTDLLVVLATFILDFVLGFLAEVNYGRYTMLFINMSKT